MCEFNSKLSEAASFEIQIVGDKSCGSQDLAMERPQRPLLQRLRCMIKTSLTDLASVVSPGPARGELRWL